MITFEFLEQYWYLFVILVFILVFMFPSFSEEEIFTLDENSTEEEKELLAKRQALIEKKNLLDEMSIDEYREKSEDKTSFPEESEELTYVNRELLSELKNGEIRKLRFEIDEVSDAFIKAKKPRIASEKLKEANELEARARELKMNMNHQAQKEALVLLKKVKEIRKMYS